LGYNITAKALEVNNAVAALVTTTDMPHRNTALVITTTRTFDCLCEAFFGLGLRDFCKIRKGFESG
jgi:hypothetical protein